MCSKLFCIVSTTFVLLLCCNMSAFELPYLCGLKTYVPLYENASCVKLTDAHCGINFVAKNKLHNVHLIEMPPSTTIPAALKPIPSGWKKFMGTIVSVNFNNNNNNCTVESPEIQSHQVVAVGNWFFGGGLHQHQQQKNNSGSNPPNHSRKRQQKTFFQGKLAFEIEKQGEMREDYWFFEATPAEFLKQTDEEIVRNLLLVKAIFYEFSDIQEFRTPCK